MKIIVSVSRDNCVSQFKFQSSQIIGCIQGFNIVDYIWFAQDGTEFARLICLCDDF